MFRRKSKGSNGINEGNEEKESLLKSDNTESNEKETHAKSSAKTKTSAKTQSHAKTKASEGKRDASGDGNQSDSDIDSVEEIVDGDYTVQVHIIEVKDLKPRDISGTSDPVCIVEAFGTKYSTSVKKKTTSCVWDTTFVFQKMDAHAIDIECSKILVSVFDHNTLQKNALIGAYEFGMGYIYNQPDHEVWRVWVPLTDVTDEFEGVQGYLKLSVAVLGPNDEIRVHTEEEEKEKDGKQTVMRSPKIKQEGHLLMAECFLAEGLPKIDSLGKCDPFITVTFAGNPPCKTSYKEKTLSPVWNERLEVPVMLPIMTDIIEVAIWDKEKVGSSRRLATFYLRYSEIPKLKQPGNIPPRWYNIYGSPIGYQNEVTKSMQNGKIEGSTYYGRILMSFYDVQKDDPQMACSILEVAKGPADVKIQAYYLRLDIYQAVEIPFEGALVQIILKWGMSEMKSEKAEVKNGLAHFGVQFPELRVEHPHNIDQCPDVFVYLDKFDLVGPPKRACYLRFKFRDIQENVENPSWMFFKEDKSIDCIPHGEFPGTILMKLSGGIGGLRIPPIRQGLVPMRFVRYVVRANIYQGRNLVAADDNGTSDPYVVMKIGGVKVKTEVKRKTIFPRWYQSIESHVNFPENLAFAPDIQILVFDRDEYSKDESIGRFSVTVKDLKKDFQPCPTWYKLKLEDYYRPVGDILASFQAIPIKQIHLYPPVDIHPPSETVKVEIFVIGLRNMESFQLLPLQQPFIEFDMGGSDKQDRHRTERSKVPSGENPNYLKTIAFDIDIPKQAMFCPTINMRVFDYRLKGAYKPLVGTASIELNNFLPWLKDDAELEDDGAGLGAGQSGVRQRGGKSGKKKKGKGQKQDKTGLQTESVDDWDLDFSDGDGPQSTPLVRLDKLKLKTAQLQTALSHRAASAFSGITHMFSEPIYPGDDVEIRVEIGEDLVPEYLRERIALDDELEDEYAEELHPFHEFSIMRGLQVQEDAPPALVAENKYFKKLQEVLDTDPYKAVGKFKGYIRIESADAPEQNPPFDLQMLMASQLYVVRVYIIKAMGLAAEDDDGLNDPYIVLELGGKKIANKDNRQENNNNPEFHESHEINALLPGASILTVSVYDYDFPGFGQLIGATEIDLENRWFSSTWQSFKKKPLENRTLRLPGSTASRGKIQLWVDIFPKSEIAKNPMIDISPPPKKDFEVRLIIWKARYMTIKDPVTKQNDLFVTAGITGCDDQRTDVHLRAKEGNGSFNYRILFPVKLPMKDPRLKLAAWDFDVFAPSDLIGEVEISLDDLFKAAYRQEMPVPLSRKETNLKNEKLLPTRDEIWLNVYHPSTEDEPQGQICISLEIVTKEWADQNPVGPKRDEPNQNPVLDPPDRLKFDIFSPMTMLKELLGADLFGRIARPMMCLCCCMLIAGFGFFVNQFAGILLLLQ